MRKPPQMSKPFPPVNSTFMRYREERIEDQTDGAEIDIVDLVARGFKTIALDVYNNYDEPVTVDVIARDEGRLDQVALDKAWEIFHKLMGLYAEYERQMTVWNEWNRQNTITQLEAQLRLLKGEEPTTTIEASV